uniref:Candidate secreted effector n=1 Tax=Meloidogyne incognita TaxID=6306 RepID=A0A914LNX5_MELIC
MKQKNDFLQIIILIFALIVRQSKSSRCVVSKWRQWGECQGDCEFALRVRNRDVLKPPFPEKDEKTLQMFLRECPPLYQVELCQPRECVDESPFNRIPTDTTQNKTKILNNEDHQLSLTQQNLRGDKIKENPNLEDPFTHIKEERKNKSLELIGILKDEGPFSTKIDLINNNKKQLKINKIDCKLPNPACCRSIRQKCANGRKPAQLTRWYRKVR